MSKRFLSSVLSVVLAASLVGCGGKGTNNTSTNDTANQSEIDKIIAEAQTMSLEELGKKAIEESNGKTFFGLGNSSRGKSALPLFIEYLQTIDPSYKLDFEWQQPKNNKIFEQLQADSLKDQGTFAMTLIQDGNQIESKMNQTGILKTFIPKEWADANGIKASDYKGFLPLQTLNKVFMYNSTGTKKFTNCWDFVRKDTHPLFMDIDSEIVGKNFLYMLTEDKYASELKDAFDKLPADAKAEFQPTIDEVAKDAESFNLGENGKYALAWIKLWVNRYNAQTDDGPICTTLTSASATDQCGLLVYSKLRSIEESSETSVNNIKVAAYEDGYQGIGGFGYCHYLFLTKNSPLPWTAAAFIAYMTCTEKGFSAWGKDMGGYSSNPDVMTATEKTFNHAQGGYIDGVDTFPSKDDRGYDWWTTKGHLVLEDPEYCASVAFTVGSWIETLDKFNGNTSK
jgi:putative lipoprotein